MSLTKKQLGEHLFKLIQERSDSILADATANKLPISRRAIYHIKEGKFSEHTLKVVAEWLGLDIETLYKIN